MDSFSDASVNLSNFLGSVHLEATNPNLNNSDGSLFFAWRQYMLTKYALMAVIALCITVLGFTLLVRDSLCEFSVRERGIEFKAVLAYESKK